MKLWIDAQISSHLAPWIKKTLAVDAYSLEYLKLDETEDEVIFMNARTANAIVMRILYSFKSIWEHHLK
jgi:predicted nuclease of predicted toxin-antitoxin system